MPTTGIPVIDLFAGSGGLSEGFSALKNTSGRSEFDIRVSIEKEKNASETLKLRAFFRHFPEGKVPECYYDYLRGNITKEELLANKSVQEEWGNAQREARQAELGKTPSDIIDKWISDALGNHDPWVLIGGPPCQAYSLAGRSRRRGIDPLGFEQDERHFLYKEYLRIIRKFQPALFVMENVKGILSSTHSGAMIFERILEDLSRPEIGLEYEIRSLTSHGDNLKPKDFIIETEKYGIPQRRHRVILFGVRRDYASGKASHRLLVEKESYVTVQQVLSEFPKIRSRLSRKSHNHDSHPNWLKVIQQSPSYLKGWSDSRKDKIVERMVEAITQAALTEKTGSPFSMESTNPRDILGSEIAYLRPDARLGGICQHVSRSHMPRDLNRYFYAACYAEIFKTSPKLEDYPTTLWPEHKNVNAEEVPFSDRFRVQCWGIPSTTVVSHIAKDGHYYIHPDPSQCRSLTVREAARLQTFRDNYYFEGNQTSQYNQIGNAVPPFLAEQIAEIVLEFLKNAQQS